ncbi:MAG: amidohydrolase family protein [Acidimicrobiia bacterium]
MRAEDMILFSIDDHIIEPSDVFENHMPAKYKDQAPQCLTTPDGKTRWLYQGTEAGTTGLGAVASWPREEWNFDPVGFAEMRPGCYDIHQRVADMNANGVYASMNFPTFPGFAGAHLLTQPDKEITEMVVSAYNDWHIDEWCGAYPGRMVPLAIAPLWDPELMAKEVRRVAAKGCKALTLPETPYGLGLPSFYTEWWDPVWQACSDCDVTVCFHIGTAFNIIQSPEGAPSDRLIIMAPQLSALVTTDLLTAGVFRKFPQLRCALSEGGIGWIPFYLDRLDRHGWNHAWTRLDIGGGPAQTPTEVFREHFLGCFITDPSALVNRDRIGIEVLAWECDFPHSDSTWPNSPEVLLAEFNDVGMNDAEINKVGYENAARFFGWDLFKHTPKEQATVGALRDLAAGVDTAITSKAEYRRRFAGAGA